MAKRAERKLKTMPGRLQLELQWKESVN